MTDRAALLVVAWRDAAPPAPAGWRCEAVLRDQSALDRAGSKGRTPPPFDAVLWSDDPESALRPPDGLADHVASWSAFRVVSHPAWDDTAATGVNPSIKQVSFLKRRAELTPDEFTRHYREHVAVARVHHPAICRYAQHDVVETAGSGGLETHGISELWFADEATLVARYYAGPDSVPVVRADNREYIDFAGTLSLLVSPTDPTPAR
ncbi:MAG TPA: EthD domain-containing protein [Acidimicrobiia bacterium]|nr:EthD domain-containing protein [Acidimicrobiia bacterium]